MGIVRKLSSLACVLGAIVTVPAFAFEVPPIPDKPEAKTLKDAPVQWRDYLVKVRAAERIADPLQRCLAFPDLPGNRWPQGHSPDHCRYHFDDKRVTPVQIGAMLDKGETDKLERLMDEHLALHSDKQNFSELIHLDLDFEMDEADQNRKIAKRWIDLAPDSAYANTAYAWALLNTAWKMRGGKFDQDTPAENMAGMSYVASAAIPYFEKAIQLNPQLMPAYEGLYDLANVDSLEDLKQTTFDAAQKVDPSCEKFASKVMNSLRPRWGGSYEQMVAYSRILADHVKERPMLAAFMAEPYADRGNRLLYDNGQYTHDTGKILDQATLIGSDEGAMHDEADLALNATDAPQDSYRAFAYLLQESRFRKINAWGALGVAWLLMQSAEPEWSLAYASIAVKEASDNPLGHYIAGADYYNTDKPDAADAEYQLAIENKDASWKQASLREAAQMWLWHGDVQQSVQRKTNAAKAKPYIDQLMLQYPDDGRGAIMDFWARAFAGAPVNPSVIRAVLKKVDRSDSWQADRARYLDTMLQHIDDAPIPSPHP